MVQHLLKRSFKKEVTGKINLAGYTFINEYPTLAKCV